jgi:hypothetical protein
MEAFYMKRDLIAIWHMLQLVKARQGGSPHPQLAPWRASDGRLGLRLRMKRDPPERIGGTRAGQGCRPEGLPGGCPTLHEITFSIWEALN